MINSLIILIIVALSLGAAPTAAREKPPSLRALKQAVAANPQDPQAHYSLGLKYESVGQSKKAVEEYRQVLSLKPDYDQALYSLGRLMGELGETEAAIEIIKQAVKLKPNSAEARGLLAAVYNQQAIAFLQQGNLDAAKEAMEAGIQAKVGTAATEALRNNLGCLYIRQGKIDEAVGAFQEVLRENPDAASARYNLSLLYYTQGDYQAANREFFALKGMDPNMAAELADYRFRIRTSTDYALPVKTSLTFKGSPLLTKGSIPSDFR